MTCVTAIHAKTRASGKKCPEGGTHIYPDLFNSAKDPLPSGIVVGFADTQSEYPPCLMVSLGSDRITRLWCIHTLSVQL
ncbi:hypothetical protein GCM10009086_50450 [Pseudomonas rhodesiae]